MSDALCSRLAHYRDLEAFLEIIRPHFDRGGPTVIARAPGRLDVMGGIADYSGSLVLQQPTAEATFAALQKSDRQVIEIVSLPQQPGGLERVFRVNLSSIAPDGEAIGYEDARTLFHGEKESGWAAYVVGAALVLMRECRLRLSTGAKIVIASSVPEGKGVASSAALEVACMAAIAAAFGVDLAPKEMALLCQKAENLVAGAPCGVMDQMTATLGSEDSLLALLCQPAEIQPLVRVPEDIAFWGLDSGVRHAVGGSSYEMVRAGAFMGLRIIAGDHDRWGGYLTNVSPQEFEREFVPLLPEEMSGEEFIERYGSTADPITRVVPGRIYKIRKPAAHPVFEHDRVKAFRALLTGSPGEEQWTSLGELMYQSHASYGACGLGSRGTDILVDLVRVEGATSGLYGARITGGGSGGTVVVVGRPDAASAIARVRERYRQAMGYEPVVFSGTSNGAASFGSLCLNHLT